MTTGSDIRPPLPRPLCAAMAIQFAIGGAVIPFSSLFLRDRGLDFTHISIIYTAGAAMLVVFPFFWGMLADRFVPLNRLFALLNLLVCGALGCLLAQHSFVGLLVAFALLTACLNPTFMLINALSFHHLPHPGLQFGRLRAWGSLGWMLPFLPISIGLALSGGRVPLDFTLIIGILLAAGMAMVTLWLPHTPPGGHHAHLPGAYAEALRTLLNDKNFVTLILSYFCMAGSFSLLTFYSFPLMADLGMPRAWLGPAQAVGVVFEYFLFQCQPQLLKRWSYPTLILAGGVALVMRQWICVVSGNLWLLTASYMLAGAAVVLHFMGVSMMVNIIAGPRVRSTAQTLLVLAGSGLGPMFANWMAGWISAYFGGGLRPVFIFATVLAGMAFLLVALRRRALTAVLAPSS